jgi:hypothetical protein
MGHRDWISWLPRTATAFHQPIIGVNFTKPGNQPLPLASHWPLSGSCWSSASTLAANAPGPLSVLRSVILSEGGFSSFLHYLYSLSDRLFSANPTSFASMSCGTRAMDFQSVPYRAWLADLLVNELRVANSSTIRGGRTRPLLEAEIILLRKLGLVRDWRIGVGIEINWPAVHSALDLASSHFN